MKQFILLLSLVLLMTLNQCKSHVDTKETEETPIQKEEITSTIKDDSCELTLKTIDSKSTSPVVLIGLYENLKNTGDHTYGYTLMIWQVEEDIIGFFNLYEGDLEPTRSGPVINGKLSGNNLSMGAWTKGSKAYDGWEQTDTYVFSFSGTLDNDELMGSLSVYNCSDNTSDLDYDKEVQLSLSTMWELESFENIKAWKEKYSYNLDF